MHGTSTVDGSARSGFWGLLAALLLHGLLGLAYLFATPAFEGPDEGDHLWAIWFLERTWTLPVPAGTTELLGRPDLAWKQHNLGHHPPLYYGTLALLERLFNGSDLAPTWHKNQAFLAEPSGTSPFRYEHGLDELGAEPSREIQALRRLRAFSVLCGLAVVWGAWALGRILFPNRPGLAVAAALGVACLPQWSFTAGLLDNGNLAAALAAPALVLLAAFGRAGACSVRAGLLWGLLVGLALLAKLTALFLPAAGALALAGALLLGRRSALPLLRPAAAAALVLALAAGWFFARNRILLGDWTGEGPKLVGYAANRIPEGRAAEHLLGPFPWLVWHSLIGNFGWQSMPLPGALARALLALPLLAALGWLLAGRRLLAAPGAGRAGALGLLALLLAAASLVHYNLKFYQPQGRYLFAVLPLLVLFVAAGLAGLLESLAPRGARRAGILASAAWVVFGLTVFWFHARPALAPPGPTSGPMDAALAFGLCTPPGPGRPEVLLGGPPDGADCSEPPEFSWRLPPGWEGRLVSVHIVRENGSLLGATWEWPRLEIRGDRWTFPQGHWDAVPRGERLLWKVRVVPDRGRGEPVAEMPESRFSGFVRR